MNCPRCFKNYNTKNNIPKWLNKCGHSICNFCLLYLFSNKSIRCPQCVEVTNENSIVNFKINENLLNSIKMNKNNDNMPNTLNNISKNISTTCDFHSKQFEAYCKSCSKLICINCIISFDENNICHKEHEILTIENSYKNERDFFIENYNKFSIEKKIFIEKLNNFELEKIEIENVKRANLDIVNIIYKELKESIKIFINSLNNDIDNIYNRNLEKIVKGEELINNKLESIDEVLSLEEFIDKENSLEFLKNSFYRNELINRANNSINNDLKKFKNFNKKELNILSEKNIILKKIIDDLEEENFKSKSRKERNGGYDIKVYSSNNISIKNKPKLVKLKTQNNIKKNNNRNIKKSNLNRK